MGIDLFRHLDPVLLNDQAAKIVPLGLTRIWGEDDPWIPLERGKALHALIPQAVFETLPGVGHLPQLEAPQLVLERLNAFYQTKAKTDEGSAPWEG
ncbi:hypothetical protein [Mesorhizobium sp.]|uniref:alpha/beta fold hydrolase n=1 Tax=Mesorhizobium sp. TaxID=1871066 RepID=UPI00257A095B|nr:hypothetical protein [Mesorhizobium sp.]